MFHSVLVYLTGDVDADLVAMDSILPIITKNAHIDAILLTPDETDSTALSVANSPFISDIIKTDINSYHHAILSKTRKVEYTFNEFCHKNKFKIIKEIANSEKKKTARFLAVKENSLDSTVFYARLADLVICGKPQIAVSIRSQRALQIQLALNYSGRPVFIPGVSAISELPKNIHVLWSGTQASVEALYSAYPFFSYAENILISIMPSETYPNEIKDELPTRLRDFSAKIEIKEFPQIEKINNTMEYFMKETNDFKSDMLVMGAYSKHRSFLQMFKSSLTRKIIEEYPYAMLLK